MSMENGVHVSNIKARWELTISLQWRHNERDGASNHQRLDCLLNCLLRRRSKKTSRLRVTGLCERNWPATGGSPRKGPVTWKMFPFDGVSLNSLNANLNSNASGDINNGKRHAINNLMIFLVCFLGFQCYMVDTSSSRMTPLYPQGILC